MAVALWMSTLPMRSALAHHPEEHADTSQHVVARVPVRNEQELLLLRQDHSLRSYVWRQGYADIVTPSNRLPADAIIDLSATRALHSRASEPASFKASTIGGFPCYRTVSQTYSDLAAMAASHPELAQWVDYGDSFLKSDNRGGHDLHALVLSNTNLPGPKPTLVIMAAMHARELATAETAVRFAEMLIDGYAVDADITWLLDYHAIHILAQQNPDGRERVENGAFDWRKNGNDNHCPMPMGSADHSGVDLNRNASTLFWGGTSSSANACRETFRGPGPGSEPESQAVEDYLRAVFPDQRDGDINTAAAPESTDGIFISIHSYGEYIFYPWEGRSIDTGNEFGYQALSQRMADRTGYIACQNCCLGTASGTTPDFAYEELGVASFTFEIGTTFRQSCASFETDVLPINLDALLYAAKAARRPYLSSAAPQVSSVIIDVDANNGSALLTAQIDGAGHAVNNSVCSPIDPVVPPITIGGARYSVDQPPHLTAESYPLLPIDGQFDSSTETAAAVIDENVVGTGRHLVFVFAEDAGGQRQGPISAAWVDFPALFSNGFEASP
jgi:hypothetical protein